MDNEELKLSLKRIINEARAQGIPVPDNISEEIYINPGRKRDSDAADSRMENIR